MHRRTMLAGLAATAFPLPAIGQTAIESASRAAIGNATTAADKVRAAIEWTHRNLNWTSTDYQQRTPEQILARGGGNCYEQAIVVRALLTPAGVPTRLTREINIQPVDSERQRTAESRIASNGFASSVFGERHNDHVWTEYLDAEMGEWLPADPTLNVIGIDGWVRARMSFGARPVHDVIPFADMLFPIAVVVPLGQGRYEKRTDRLLVLGFASHIRGVWRSSHWRDWVRLVRTAEDHLILALQNRRNFHQDAPLLDALISAYAGLRATST